LLAARLKGGSGNLERAGGHTLGRLTAGPRSCAAPKCCLVQTRKWPSVPQLRGSGKHRADRCWTPPSRSEGPCGRGQVARRGSRSARDARRPIVRHSRNRIVRHFGGDRGRSQAARRSRFAFASQCAIPRVCEGKRTPDRGRAVRAVIRVHGVPACRRTPPDARDGQRVVVAASGGRGLGASGRAALYDRRIGQIIRGARLVE
jgi:hypothetical protein